MTNWEYLESLANDAPGELQAWFDSEHVENANATSHGDTAALDAKDSREKLEAEISNFGFIMNLEGYQLDMIHGWLDRQAAITAHEYEFARQLDREATEFLQGKVDELRAERDNLAADLAECEAERERYRALFGKALDFADEIIGLGMGIDEGAA